MGRHTTTGGTTRRRTAGVVVGLVVAAGALGVVPALAADGPAGCPSGYTLRSGSCTNGAGSTIPTLTMLPGDADPESGEVLLPVTPGSTPTSTTSPPESSTPAPESSSPSVPESSTPAAPESSSPSVPESSSPSVPESSTPSVPASPAPSAPRPGSLPCRLPGQQADTGAVVRTATAVDRARTTLVTDVRRRAPVATLRADAAALASAIRAHVQAVNGARPCGLPAQAGPR